MAGRGMRASRLLPLLAAVLVAAQGAAALQYSLVQLVDVSPDGSVFLFRGDEPLDGDGDHRAFPYEKFKRMVVQRAKAEGHDLDDDFYTIDVSLIGQEEWEKGDLKREESYFNQRRNSDDGEVLNWVLTGNANDDPLGLKSYQRAVRAIKLQAWQHDDLPRRVQELRKMVVGPARRRAGGGDTRPTVIYVHCEHGMDRTGELVSAYQMTYLRMRFDRAQARSDRLGPRAMQPQYHNALQWYCYYLELVEGRKKLHCGHKDSAFIYRSRRS